MNVLQNQISKKFIVGVLMFLIFQFGCSQEPSPYDELIDHEYYAYTVPDDVLVENGWTLRTPIKNEERYWDAHCEGGPSAPFNPLNLYYQNEQERQQEQGHQLSISISDYNVIWDHREPYEIVQLNTPWAKDGTGIIYKDEPLSGIKFVDVFGNDVTVSSRQTVAEKVLLINQFEYIGPPRDMEINPWSVEWCEQNQRDW